MMVGIAQLRTSTHKLAIETGRYQRPVVPSNERVCRICNSGQVEDEIHFIGQCTAYNEHRKFLIQEINLTHFTGSEEEQFAIIMTPTKEEDFEALGQYIFKCFRTRKDNPSPL